MASEPATHSPSASPERSPSLPVDDTSQSQPATIAHSTASIDSETLLLNPSTEKRQESPRPKPSRKNTDLKQCWICYADETEDSPSTSRWRSPCACSLVAHESCLLDWVADLETPATRRTRGAVPKIQCPQCKSEIKVARPRNFVLEAIKTAERYGTKLLVPGIVAVLVGGAYTGATMHGISSMFLIFGRTEFQKLVDGPTISGRWLIAFPFIPVILIMSRTNIGDRILPTVPLLVFATGFPQKWLGSEGHTPLWPPSPELAFASLPFIRSVYIQLWRRLFAEKEAQWTKIVQPRAGAAGEGDVAAADHAVQANNGAIDIFNFEVEIVGGDEANIAAEQPEIQAEPAAPGAGGEPGNEGEPAQNNNADQPRAQQQPRGITITGTYLIELVMGALAFPTIASAMGELLRIGLPKSWTTPPQLMFRVGSYASPWPLSKTGFLQHKWARSIVGGCLFVVMKDTLLLYSKYRTAKDHQKRRICNWDKTLGRFVDDGT